MRTSWILGVVLGASMSVACGEPPIGENVDETTNEGDSAQTTSSSRTAPVTTEDEPERLEAAPAADQSAYEEACKRSLLGCSQALKCTKAARGSVRIETKFGGEASDSDVATCDLEL